MMSNRMLPPHLRRCFPAAFVWPGVVGFAIALGGFSTGFRLHAAATGADSQVVRLVADKVLAETPFTLRNTWTGQGVTDSTAQPDDAPLTISSRWNQWFYPSLLVGEGLLRVGEQLDRPDYREFSARQVTFIADHTDWFQRSWAQRKTLPDGFTDLGHYLNVYSLAYTGLAAPCIARYFDKHDERLAGYVQRFRRMVETHPRDRDGLLLERDSVRTDDIYLMGPGLYCLGVGTGERRFIDDAVHHVLAAHRRLFIPGRQLHRQSWNAKTRRFDGDFWGRGSGWMVLAMTDLLVRLDPAHPRRKEVLAAFRETMAGLRRWQAPDGGWRQIIDSDSDWIETSCTGMFTYAMARGVCEGWIGPSYAADAHRAWAALVRKVQPDGTLVDICPATPQGTRDWYLGRPRATDDVHGYGPFLLAGSQILRLDRRAP